MDLLNDIWQYGKPVLVGMLLAQGVGPWFTYRGIVRHLTIDKPTTFKDRKPRAQVRKKYLNGAVSIQDVLTHLRSSLKGYDLTALDNSAVMMTYMQEYHFDTFDFEDPYSNFFDDSTTESNDAAHAILHWLYRCPDWDLLLACLHAGLTPDELRDHVDGVRVFTRDEVEFLAALRP